MAQVTFETFFYESTTDRQGIYNVPHGLEVFRPDGFRIQGIIVSVQHLNQNWHTVEISNQIDNRFFWNKDVLRGKIDSPNFFNRPVKIIVFATRVVG